LIFLVISLSLCVETASQSKHVDNFFEDNTAFIQVKDSPEEKTKTKDYPKSIGEKNLPRNTKKMMKKVQIRLFLIQVRHLVYLLIIKPKLKH